MTKPQAYPLSSGQHQQPAKLCARWIRQLCVLTLPPLRCAHAGQGERPAPRPETDARSLHGVKVAAHVSHRHPAAYWLDKRVGAVRVCDARHLNFTVLDLGRYGVVTQALTSVKSGSLNLDKCLHGISPKDGLSANRMIDKRALPSQKPEFDFFARILGPVNQCTNVLNNKFCALLVAAKNLHCGLNVRVKGHLVSPVDGLNIAHLALFNTTVRRKVSVIQ